MRDILHNSDSDLDNEDEDDRPTPESTAVTDQVVDTPTKNLYLATARQWQP